MLLPCLLDLLTDDVAAVRSLAAFAFAVVASRLPEVALKEAMGLRSAHDKVTLVRVFGACCALLDDPVQLMAEIAHMAHHVTSTHQQQDVQAAESSTSTSSSSSSSFTVSGSSPVSAKLDSLASSYYADVAEGVTIGALEQAAAARMDRIRQIGTAAVKKRLADAIRKEMVPRVRLLASDRVPNVRLCVARVLARAAGAGEYATAVLNECRDVVRALRSDSDSDVRSLFANVPTAGHSQAPGSGKK
jgi:hypothetical protein